MSLPALLEQRLRLPVVAAPMFLISNPQLVLACCRNGVVGSFPALNPGVFSTGGWIHAKLTLVVLLIGYHHMCGAQVKRFARGENTRSHVFYRWFNEVPVLILLAIVILVVVKPF